MKTSIQSTTKYETIIQQTENLTKYYKLQQIQHTRNTTPEANMKIMRTLVRNLVQTIIHFELAQPDGDCYSRAIGVVDLKKVLVGRELHGGGGSKGKQQEDTQVGDLKEGSRRSIRKI